MSILPPLIAFILRSMDKPAYSIRFLWKKVLGGILIIQGASLAVYASYKLFVPLLGEGGSALLISVIILIIGGLLLYHKASSSRSSAQDLLTIMEKTVKQLSLPLILKGKTGKVIGTALGMALALVYLKSRGKN